MPDLPMPPAPSSLPSSTPPQHRDARQLVQRGCGTAIFGIFALAGLAFFIGFAWALGRGMITKFWTPTPCVIEQVATSAAGRLEATKAPDEPALRYRYTAAGTTHTGTEWRRGANEKPERDDLARLTNALEAGGAWTCYVNPKNPAESVLEPPLLWPLAFLLVPLLFIAIGLGGVFGCWREKTTAKRRGPPGVLGALITGLIFTIVGAAVLYFSTIVPGRKVLAARSWPAVECEILSSAVGRQAGSKGGSTYRVEIDYRYRYDGRTFVSSRYNFLSGSSSGREGKEVVVRRYPAGSKAQCWVNPDAPHDAVLDRSASPFMLFGGLGLAFIGAGALVVFNGLRARVTNTALRGPALPGAAAAGGPVELRASASPAVKLFGAVLIALFWNGIVAVFVSLAVQGWRQGRAEWFLMVFLIPFVAIGVGLLFLVVHSFLNLFNPRLRLTVNRTTLTPGDTLDLRWKLEGRAERLDRLSFTCECEQAVTTGTGKNRRVSRTTLRSVPVAEATEPRTIAQGQGSVVIPPDAPLTGHEGRTEIIWKIKAKGSIPRFPDFSDDYPISVESPSAGDINKSAPDGHNRPPDARDDDWLRG